MRRRQSTLPAETAAATADATTPQDRLHELLERKVPDLLHPATSAAAAHAPAHEPTAVSATTASAKAPPAPDLTALAAALCQVTALTSATERFCINVVEAVEDCSIMQAGIARPPTEIQACNGSGTPAESTPEGKVIDLISPDELAIIYASSDDDSNAGPG